jgi:PKD repeat protein
MVAALLSTTACPAVAAAEPQVFRLRAKDTLTAVELNTGDTLELTLRNGQTRTLTLQEADARVLLTNLAKPSQGFHGGGTVYEFTAKVRIDGHPMTMRRYVPVQESFYEPYVVNGMRIWFDCVRRIGAFLNENHGACLPEKEARFAVQDAALPVCPQPLRPWYPNPNDFIDVVDCYNGNDCWIGPYQGADAHGGLDVNMAIGTPLWAPLDFDDHYLFDSLADGANNNRWRGIRRWPNGDVWTLQSHHVVRLLVPEHEPIRQGTHYAVAAGVLCGSHAHSHFVFKTGEGDQQILLDPWILFWQIFENNRDRAAAIRAAMTPLEPAVAGKAVSFNTASRAGPSGNGLAHYWTFGDGGWSHHPNPTHAYLKPGLYPVTLVVDDGARRASITQHLSVDGQPADAPGLALAAPDEPSFRRRAAEAMDVYGRPVRFIPHTLEFLARPRSRPKPAAKTIVLQNVGAGDLGDAHVRVEYRDVPGWLAVERSGSGNRQRLRVAADAGRLKPKLGDYVAVVTVDCPGAANSPQGFRVRLRVPERSPPSTVTVDNLDEACWATPYFWLAPRFHDGWPEGYRDTYLTNAGRAAEGEIVRFTPDVAAGEYEVSFHEATPFRPSEQVEPEIRFTVRVRHKGGVDVIQAEPLESSAIGTFELEEGSDGYVEIHAGGSRGIVVADAIVFRRVGR